MAKYPNIAPLEIPLWWTESRFTHNFEEMSSKIALQIYMIANVMNLNWISWISVYLLTTNILYFSWRIYCYFFKNKHLENIWI